MLSTWIRLIAFIHFIIVGFFTALAGIFVLTVIFAIFGGPIVFLGGVTTIVMLFFLCIYLSLKDRRILDQFIVIEIRQPQLNQDPLAIEWPNLYFPAIEWPAQPDLPGDHQEPSQPDLPESQQDQPGAQEPSQQDRPGAQEPSQQDRPGAQEPSQQDRPGAQEPSQQDRPGAQEPSQQDRPGAQEPSQHDLPGCQQDQPGAQEPNQQDQPGAQEPSQQALPVPKARTNINRRKIYRKK